MIFALVNAVFAIAGLCVLSVGMFYLLRILYYDSKIYGKVVAASCAQDGCTVTLQYSPDSVQTFQVENVATEGTPKYSPGDSIAVRVSSSYPKELILDRTLYDPLIVGLIVIGGACASVVSATLLFVHFRSVPAPAQ